MSCVTSIMFIKANGCWQPSSEGHIGCIHDDDGGEVGEGEQARENTCRCLCAMFPQWQVCSTLGLRYQAEVSMIHLLGMMTCVNFIMQAMGACEWG